MPRPRFAHGPSSSGRRAVSAPELGTIRRDRLRPLPCFLRAFFLSIIFLSAFFLSAIAPTNPAAYGDLVNRGASLLQGQGADELGATLEIEAACVLEEPSQQQAAGGCILQVVVPAPPSGLLRYRLGVAIEDWDGAIRNLAMDLPGTVTAGAPWVVLAPLPLQPDDRSLVLVLEPSANAGQPWGGALIALSGELLPVAREAVITEASEWGSPGGGSSAAGAGATATADSDKDLEERWVRIIPPGGQALEGTVRFDVLAASDSVDRVVFRLDGREVETDSRAPFSARLDLGSPREAQILQVLAYDRKGRELGDDQLSLDAGDRPLRLSLRLEGDPGSGSVEAVGQVSVPEGRRLARVEIYVGDERMQTVTTEDFRSPVSVPPDSPSAYVRALATLDDGSSIDAVELLGAISDRVNVDLAEVFAVVSDAQGNPLGTLRKDDFRLRANDRAREIESLSSAADVPLLLGVVIDSSGSMRFQMNEAKQAAGEFLGKMVGQDDQAFLVDFDSQPRLARAPTGDLPHLFSAFNELRPEGFTALYDSIVFSLLHFQTNARARRALVVLTDGDDYRSRFGPRRAIEDARRAGVPVYIVALGEEQQVQRTLANSDLKEVTEATGGRVFAVSEPTQLGSAYNRIEKELRNQYLLTFYAEPGELIEEVEVELTREGLSARSVVGQR
ncbi:MAG: VWA domain-containing protein [Acidobacteriota bacterium]